MHVVLDEFGHCNSGAIAFKVYDINIWWIEIKKQITGK